MTISVREVEAIRATALTMNTTGGPTFLVTDVKSGPLDNRLPGNLVLSK